MIIWYVWLIIWLIIRLIIRCLFVIIWYDSFESFLCFFDYYSGSIFWWLLDDYWMIISPSATVLQPPPRARPTGTTAPQRHRQPLRRRRGLPEPPWPLRRSKRPPGNIRPLRHRSCNGMSRRMWRYVVFTPPSTPKHGVVPLVAGVARIAQAEAATAAA